MALVPEFAAGSFVRFWRKIKSAKTSRTVEHASAKPMFY
jgi:hypothetical protein